MTRFEVTVDILSDKKYWIYFLITLGLWVGGLWFHPLLMMAGCITFALFDLVGYEGVPESDKQLYPLGTYTVQSYRILQAMFQIALIAILLTFSWKLALGFIVIHLTGGCDILYDLIGRYPVCLSYPRTWLRWTPLGWFRKEIGNFGFITQAIVGLILTVILVW